ncbi:hypothetical protein ARMGADRAFT_613489 [Armillaria gallica]|uniref:Uncharacterized protein n=1 Tax=Armillaria gallica TaxID=47427 RepID=A0A2H3CM90_ARMGA|nr:hypothetical protein ARMGADRAFT_613489 [Armillaria gallica]
MNGEKTGFESWHRIACRLALGDMQNLNKTTMIPDNGYAGLKSKSTSKQECHRVSACPVVGLVQEERQTLLTCLSFCTKEICSGSENVSLYSFRPARNRILPAKI